VFADDLPSAVLFIRPSDMSLMFIVELYFIFILHHAAATQQMYTTNSAVWVNSILPLSIILQFHPSRNFYRESKSEI